jgi:hypothetical protein
LKLRLAVQGFCSKSLELTISIRCRNFLRVKVLAARAKKKRKKLRGDGDSPPRKMLSRSKEIPDRVLVQTESDFNADLYVHRVTVFHRRLKLPLLHG